MVGSAPSHFKIFDSDDSDDSDADADGADLDMALAALDQRRAVAAALVRQFLLGDPVTPTLFRRVCGVAWNSSSSSPAPPAVLADASAAAAASGGGGSVDTNSQAADVATQTTGCRNPDTADPWAVQPTFLHKAPSTPPRRAQRGLDLARVGDLGWPTSAQAGVGREPAPRLSFSGPSTPRPCRLRRPPPQGHVEWF